MVKFYFEQNGSMIEMEVKPEGNLALLALGYEGVLAWKAVRRAHGLPDMANPETPLHFDAIDRKKNNNGKK
ncbi:MAG: hypothetical protein N2Z72_02160 [Bacteroidales bacterium]|nr:hypothetical protein [Bacteroidales bacterium]